MTLAGRRPASADDKRAGFPAPLPPIVKGSQHAYRISRPRQHGRPNGPQPAQGWPQPDRLRSLPQAVAALVEAGARAADSPAAVAKAGVEVIITMLPTADHVKQVYRGKDGLLANIGPGVLLIDSSTIDPLSTREVAKYALAQGNPMLDAPVSGGTGGAAAGTLTFMVGGPDSVFDQALPILSAMGKNIVHCGAAGNGQVAKIANNMLLGISMVGVAEAMALGVSPRDGRQGTGRDHQYLQRSLLELGGQQPVPGRTGKRAGLTRLQRRIWQRPDAQGSGPGHRSGQARASTGGARCRSPAAVPDLQPAR